MDNVKNSVISPKEAVTLSGLFFQRVKRSPDLPAYRYFDNSGNQWKTYTWAEAAAEVYRWQTAFQKENLQAGDRVAVMMHNCPEWVFFDIAAMANGLVTVPLYTQDHAENIAYVLQDSGSKLLFIGKQEHWDCLFPVVDRLSTLHRIISTTTINTHHAIVAFNTIDQWLPETGQEVAIPIDTDSVATIVYTSGTTGRPKGVMLSHFNILWNAYQPLQMISIELGELFLSFLPLSHTLERTAGYYLPIMVGATVAYNRSIPQLGEDLLEVQPTMMISVPRIFERVFNKIQAGLEEKSPIAQKLFQFAVSTGWQRFEYQQGRGSWSPAFILWPLLYKLVGSKVMAKLGGKLKMTVVGGAPLPVTVSKLFIGLGLPMLQGYGLTETSPVISVNTPDHNDPASVGVILDGIETRIAKHDELQVKTPSAMKGYWNNEQATHDIIDDEGWLHTGDKAKIENGFLYITGRLKEIIVLATGEKVPPADMQMAICEDTLFEQVMVIGDNRPYLSALVVLNAEQWPDFARQAGVDPSDLSTCNQETIINLLQARISDQVSHFPGYAEIKKIHCSLEPWTIENGLLTPTLKLKRKVVHEGFSKEIDLLYKNHD
ncbi:MAG: long-chain fatty acid--CoA ligase [Gammaproteobacteria bacterium]